ncbi:MAG: hypothetical protein ABI305_03355 [Tepidiformaceae bacterium]
MSLRSLLAALALSCALLGAGCAQNDPSNSPVATPSVHQVAPNDSVLNQARLEAAKDSNSQPVEVKLVELRNAGWDGCFGVNTATACDQLFVGGVVAIFDSAGKQLRYHLVGQKIIGPVDPAQASAESPVPDNLASDMPALLSAYARFDAALRDKVDVSTISVEAIIPAKFPKRCRITSPAGGCTPAEGAFVQLSGASSPYLDATQAGLFPVDNASASGGTGVANSALFGVQEAMRQDLAGRLKVELTTVSMTSYANVVWPDGCLGVKKPGIACSQIVTQGFLATLSDVSGKSYIYHGTGTRFIAASFEPNAQLTNPIHDP